MKSTQKEAARPGELAQRPHRPGHLGDLAGAAVIGAVEDGHAALTGDPKAGLELLAVEPAVLGMGEPGGGDEPLLGLLRVQRAADAVVVQRLG